MYPFPIRLMLKSIPAPIVGAFALGAGCVATSGPPDLGPCAVLADGATFGEVGIGSCLSGPADLQFVERDGRTWLAVSNADPFINFSGGSVLMLDWADVVGRFDSTDVLTSEVDSVTIETEHFIGGMGWWQDSLKNILFVTSRFSGDARTRTNDDSVRIVDVDAGAFWNENAAGSTDMSTITLKDDPGAVAVASDGTTYVLNYTDHSVSVIEAGGEVVVPIDLAPEAAIIPYPLEDADDSGSVAEIDRYELIDETRAVDDAWTLTWLPGQYRAWSTDGIDVQRWESGGGPPVEAGLEGTFTPTAPGIAGDVRDPFLIPLGLDNITSSAPFTLGAGGGYDLTMLLAAGGAIFRADTRVFQDSGGLSTFWDTTEAPLLRIGSPGAFDELRGGPSMSIADGALALYFDAARSSAPGSKVISRALSLDGGGTFSTASAAVLSPAGTAYDSFEQPYVQIDDRMNTSRMWLSMFERTDPTGDGRYVVGYSESVDGLTWTEPVEVTDFGLAAPVVRFVDSQYVMWAARWDPSAQVWDHVKLDSADGIDWSEPVFLMESAGVQDLRSPPRLAVDVDPSSAWRVEGIDSGNNGLPAVAGLFYRDVSHGYQLTVASGHELPNTVFPDGRAALGLVPGSHYDMGGIDRLYVTNTGTDERQRISLLEGIGDSWTIRARNVIPGGSGGNESGVHSPVVHEFDDTFVMFYAALDANGVERVFAATSPDGLAWDPTGPVFVEPDEELGAWASAAVSPGSVEVTDDGTVRLWLSGTDGSRFRIGLAEAVDFDPSQPHLGFAHVPGPLNQDFHLGAGIPGSVDDSGARDPMVLRSATGETVMWYSAFDGAYWHLAFATRAEDGIGWVRRADPDSEETLPAMSRISRTFSAGGVYRPVARLRADGNYEIWYAGTDFAEAGVPRLGRAVGRVNHAFPIQRRPTFGDTIGFDTLRGDAVRGVIELAQNVETFLTTGIGTTGLVLDEQRGFLFVPSKLSNLLYVVDIRDDSRPGFVDYNAMDLEGLIRLPTVAGTNGFRGGVISPVTDRMYLTTRNPESVVVIDLDAIEDNGEKEVTEAGTFGSLPMQDTFFDAGVASVAAIGGAHPAITHVPSGAGTDELLLVPHFRDNSLSIFDLGIGAVGSEVAYIPYLGENPHLVRVSPDGNWAVVANYLGDVDADEQSSSTLAVIDLNPESQTFMQVTNWIKNR